jgi:Holliday junction DNA helicase RuvB
MQSNPDNSPLDAAVPADPRLEITLRPALLDQFVGQARIKERLDVLIGAAKARGDSLEHLLFCGPPGLGKTSLAHIVAKAMDVQIVTTSGTVIEKAGDLAGLLTTLQKGDVLFIDEIHRLNKNIEEYLYPAMEDFRLDIIIDQGPNARSVRLNLPRFTLIGATTRAGMISPPLRSRFGLVNRLDYYPAEDLQHVVERSARLLNVEIDSAAAFEIARRARGTPRIANNLLRWVRDYALVRATQPITASIADAALTMLEIDQDGLDEMDKRLLEALIHKFDGGPVGVNSLAVAIGEEPGTLEEVHEPYLIMTGFLKRTPQGRVAAKRAYDKLGLKPTGQQKELF